MTVTTDFDEFIQRYNTPLNVYQDEYKIKHNEFMKDFIWMWHDAGWNGCGNEVTTEILDDRRDLMNDDTTKGIIYMHYK